MISGEVRPFLDFVYREYSLRKAFYNKAVFCMKYFSVRDPDAKAKITESNL